MGRPDAYYNNYFGGSEIIGITNGFEPTFWYVAKRKELLANGVDLNETCYIEECRNYAKEAQDVGHRVHSGIEHYLKTKNLEEAMREVGGSEEVVMLEEFASIIKEKGWFGGESEVVVTSKKHGYGGTPDYILGDTIFDWKTDSVPRSKQQDYERFLKYQWQLALYAIAYEEETGKKLKWGHIVRVSKDTPPKVAHYKFRIDKTLKDTVIVLNKIHKLVKGSSKGSKAYLENPAYVAHMGPIK